MPEQNDEARILGPGSQTSEARDPPLPPSSQAQGETWKLILIPVENPVRLREIALARGYHRAPCEARHL